MRLIAALEGDLESYIADELKAAERATSAGINAAANGLKSDLRQQVRSAGLGNRLAQAWRSESYPRGRASINAAALVFSKAPLIHRAFNEGALIRSKSGFWLAIPTEAAGKAPRGQRMTPALFERMTGLQLQMVYRPGKPGLLVAQGRLSRRGTAKANVTRGKNGAYTRTTGRTSIVAFVVVPQVRLRRLLDINSAAARWQSALPGLIARAWK